MRQNDIVRGSWNSINNLQISCREEFGSLLKRMHLSGMGIEIGVANGDFSKVIIENSPLETIYLLDAWQHFDSDYVDINNLSIEEHYNRYFNVLAIAEKYGNRVKVIRADCDYAVKFFLDESFDFVYIDANHSYEAVTNDLKKWYSKVKVGGIFAGHDYLNGNINGTEFGVKNAVDDFISKLDERLYVTTDDTPFIFNNGVKTLAPKHLRYFSWYFQRTK